MVADLNNVNSIIIVFAMQGCPACHDYVPKLTKMVQGFQAHGAPFVFHTGGKLRRGQIPVLVIDGASADPGITELANQYAVEAMPTTILLTRTARPVKLEGALEDEELYGLLSTAAHASR